MISLIVNKTGHILQAFSLREHIIILTLKNFHGDNVMWLPFKLHLLLVSMDPGRHGCHCKLSSEHSSVVPLTNFDSNFNLASGNFPIILNCIGKMLYLGIVFTELLHFMCNVKKLNHEYACNESIPRTTYHVPKLLYKSLYKLYFVQL